MRLDPLASPTRLFGSTISALGLAVATCAPAGAVPLLPDFAAATFLPGDPIDNPYFPILDSRTYVYEGTSTVDGVVVIERFELTNLGSGPTILGVQTTNRRDRAFDDGVLVEDTFDYYAQDTAGNVWYFGEDVTNYVYDDEGNLIDVNDSSSWRAGVNGALPGWALPADTSVGLNYYQEFAFIDEAVDQGTTVANDIVLDTVLGTFTNVLKVLETSEIDPDARGFKYYAPGFGLIFEEGGLDANFANPTDIVPFAFVRDQVPAPAALALFGLGVLALALRPRLA